MKEAQINEPELYDKICLKTRKKSQVICVRGPLCELAYFSMALIHSPNHHHL